MEPVCKACGKAEQHRKEIEHPMDQMSSKWNVNATQLQTLTVHQGEITANDT